MKPALAVTAALASLYITYLVVLRSLFPWPFELLCTASLLAVGLLLYAAWAARPPLVSLLLSVSAAWLAWEMYRFLFLTPFRIF